MHSDVHTPVIGMNGAGGDPVHGDMHTIGGRAGGDPVQNRRALGLPESLNPGRERSHTLEEMGLWQCSGVEVHHLSASVH